MFQTDQEPDAKPAARLLPGESPRFAGFPGRLLCVAADLGLAVLAGGAVHHHLAHAAGLAALQRREAVLLLLLGYFWLSWASALRATPVQWLFGLRVVDQSGGRLTAGRALARSALLVILIAGALTVVLAPYQGAQWLVVVASLLLLGMAAVSRSRQAAHDVLARSLVVKAGTLRTPAGRAALREFVTETDPAARRRGRPSPLSMAGNLVTLGLLAMVLFVFASEHKRRDRLYRVSYAMRATEPLRSALAAYHREHAGLPDGPADLGIEMRTPYPDGGYFELLDGGTIRIRFTQTPELMRGQLILTPLPGSEGFIWHCHVDGDIAPAYLPPRCRKTWRIANGGGDGYP